MSQLIISPATSWPRRQLACVKEPTESAMLEQYNDYRGRIAAQGHESMFTAVPYRLLDILSQLNESDNEFVTRDVIYNNRECDTAQETDSSCPSYHVLNTDPTRWVIVGLICKI
jgi:hypothetical protein